MKRSQFLIVAALVPGLFGLLNMFAPDGVRSILTVDVNAAARAANQWYGLSTFALGVANFLARSDSGSRALRALMIGNILFHILAVCFQAYHCFVGLMTTSGLVFAVVSHSLLALGFIFFLLRLSRQPQTV